MKILLDQNLSRRLLGSLDEIWPDSNHVALLGLDTSSDSKVWEYAAEHGYCIVSKDSDFLHMASLYGAPPKTIIIATGNVSTDEIKRCFMTHQNEINQFLQNTEEAVLVIP